MANVATPSTSTDVRTTLTTEINFEDLISLKNDSNIASKADNTTGSTEKEVTTSVKASNVSPKFNLTKIAPKPTATTTKIAAVKGSSGKVVIIQGPEGNPLPIRIAGSSSNTSTTTTTPTIVATKPANTTIISNKTTAGNMATKTSTTVAGAKQSPVTIQVLKMPDGSLVQIKNNKALNLTNLSNISQLNVASKIPGLPVIVKTANGPKTVFGAQTRLPPGSQILKSLTLSEAQKAGFLKPKPLENAQANKLQKILPAPLSTATTAPSTPTSPTNSTTTVAKKEVTIKSESDGTTKQIIVPQHMLKSNAGPIQAIQITGKPGLQYVRVLTPGSSGTASKVVAAMKKEPNSPSKQQIIGTHRIVMNANGKPGLSFVSSSGNKEAVQSTKTTAKTSVLSTVPTLRKIQDPSGSKMISIVQKEKDNETTGTNQVAIKRISYTNTGNHFINKSSSSSSQPTSSSQSTTSSSTTSTNANSKAQFLVVPHQVLRKIQSTDHNKANNNSIATVSEEKAPAKQFSTLKSVVELPEEFGMPISRKRSPTPEALRRKHCNCTKSQCLKLYCDCFANGEFCQDCNCKECFNNLEYEDERQKAIKICLERNPNAFKPKITKAKDQSDLRLHNKGCNCKRSGCLKNYCECYEAKIACSSNCKCFGCRNVEDRSGCDSFEESKPAAAAQQGVVGRSSAYKRPHEEISERPSTSSGAAASTARASDGQPPNKQPYNFITQDVVDATIQCMIAQADECHKSGMTNKTTERMIIEELGRCLVEIIDFSIRNMEN